MDNYQQYRLGKKAFVIFMLRRIKFSLFLFMLAGGMLYFYNYLPLPYRSYGELAAKFMLLVAISYLLMVWFRTYLEYRNYTYGFSNEAFIVTSGFVDTNEVAAVYHQIHSVNIQRSYAERLLGISKLIILMTGNQRNPEHTQIILPGLHHKTARGIQRELLIQARKHIVPQNQYPDQDEQD